MPTTPGPATGEPADEAAALAAFSAAALSATGEGDLVAALVPVAYELLGADQLHLIELSADGTVGHASVVLTDGRPPQGYTMVIDERASGTAHAARSGELLHVPEARGSDRLRPDFTARFDVRTAVFVPLAWSGEVRWVCVVIREEPRPFTDHELDRVRVVCNLHAAGLALIDARAAERAREEQDGALARAAAAITGSLDLTTVLETVSREAHVALGADSAGVYLADGTGGGIATAGHQTPEGWVGYRIRPGEGVGGRVLQTGRSAFTNAYQDETQLPTQPGLRRLQTAVAVPMRWDEELKGTLSIGFERLRRIDAADLRTLEAFADLATVACRNAETFGRLSAAAREQPG